MNKLLAFFILCIVLLGTATAGHAEKISLSDVQLNFSLDDYRLEDIIDGTDDKLIGYAYTGSAHSSLEQIFFDDSITEEFEKIFKPVFSKSPDAIPLVIRINAIEVNEWTIPFQDKINMISFSISIFQEMGNDQFILIDDKIVNDISSDPSKSKSIAQRIGVSINRTFEYLDLIVDANRPPLTWSALWDYKPFQGLPYPKLSKDITVFEHYSDFRKNQPMEGYSFEVEDENALVQLISEDLEQCNTSVWGFAKDERLYINIGYGFVPVSSEQQTFALKPPGLNISFLRVGHFLGQPSAEPIALSPITGFFYIKSLYDKEYEKQMDMLSSMPILEFAPFGKSDGTMQIRNSDGLLVQLRKGEFFQVPEGVKASELEACIEGKCLSIITSEAPMHRIIFKKGALTTEPFTEKERMRFLRNVEPRFWVLF